MGVNEQAEFGPLGVVEDGRSYDCALCGGTIVIGESHLVDQQHRHMHRTCVRSVESGGEPVQTAPVVRPVRDLTDDELGDTVDEALDDERGRGVHPLVVVELLRRWRNLRAAYDVQLQLNRSGQLVRDEVRDMVSRGEVLAATRKACAAALRVAAEAMDDGT